MTRHQIALMGARAFKQRLNDPQYAAQFSKRCRVSGLHHWNNATPEFRRLHAQSVRVALSQPSAISKMKAAPKNTKYIMSAENRKRCSERMKRLWASKKGRRELNAGEFLKPESLERIRAGARNSVLSQVSPTIPEKRLSSTLSKYFPKQFVFNVLRGSTVGGKIPDFIHRTRKLVVEMFGVFWHGLAKTGRTRAQESLKRKKHFHKHGFDCVIVWQDELEPVIVERISAALGVRAS